MKKILSAIVLLVLSLGVMTGCMPQGPITNDTSLKGYYAMGNASIFGDGTTSILPDYADEEREKLLKDYPDTVTNEAGTLEIEKDAEYNRKETVALYLHSYGILPKNYVTKDEAKEAGWEGGNIEEYTGEGTALGGNEFGNYEGILPGGESITYYECDLNTVGKDERGSARLVWSDKDNIYFTDDHYETFTPVYVDGVEVTDPEVLGAATEE